MVFDPGNVISDPQFRRRYASARACALAALEREAADAIARAEAAGESADRMRGRTGDRSARAQDVPARRGPCAFRQRDVTRAIKAARAAGVEHPVVRLTDARGATIAIEAASPTGADGGEPDGGIVL